MNLNQIELSNSSDTILLQKLITDTTRLKKYRMVCGSLDTILPNGAAIKILVVPLVLDATGEHVHLEGQVALFICNPNILHLTSQQLSSCYGLTHAEANLVTKLIEGMNIEQSAKKLGITYSSARTYLKQVFVKLKIKRQSELVLHILTGVLGHLPQDSTINNFRKKQRAVG